MSLDEARLARRRVYRRRRQVAGGGLLLCCALVVLVGSKVTGAPEGGTGVAVAVPDVGTKVNSAVPEGGAKVDSAVPERPFATSAPKAAEPVALGATGEFACAGGSTAAQGTGTVRRYRVEVETGIGQDANAFARAVDSILANPSSWSGQGRWSLQRVAGDNADFIIRLAGPATVDKLCAKAGLDTRGYVSCRAGRYVMINLDRWMQAVPDYRGDVGLYRKYVINHEVGHQLGYGHQACPRPGALAPVMQQQTFGLNGCRANGWPFASGVLVTGPAAS